MIIYFIKSTAIVAIVLGLYLLFLEKEKMHRFNRFYLLFGLICAYTIPLITVGSLEPAQISTLPLETEISISPTDSIINNSISIDYTRFALWIYLFISGLLLVRFFRNIGFFIKTISKSDIREYMGQKLALMKKRELPHTFFHYIFLNREDYLNQKIDDDLLAHEITHAKELHTLDVVLIEILKILFWINPVLYWYKRALQLNHEFIADESVINRHGNTKEYQSLLLQVARGHKEIYLASNIHFSLTKKRLQMMTKSYSRWKAYVYAGLSVPLFVALFMCFGHYASAQSSPDSDSEKKEEIFKNTVIVIYDHEEQKVFKNFENLPDKYKKMIPLPPPPPPLPSGATPNEEKRGKMVGIGMIHFDVESKSITKVVGDDLDIPPPPPKAPKPPKVLKAPKVSKAPKAVKAPKPPKAVKAPKAAKAPKTPKALVPPPPPPPPPNPIDMAVKIAKSGGMFFLDGKEVSSDEAIRVLKNTDHIATIDVNHLNGRDVMKINMK